jgi:60 kDa SS-A/Ro ribonucleoprotein
MKAQKSFGARARRAFSNWYLSRGTFALARQVSKYQQREGWSHRDVLRLAHVDPTGLSEDVQATLRWASGQPMTEHTIVRKNNPDKPEVRPDLTRFLPPVIVGLELAKKAATVEEIVALIQQYKLEREHIPTQWLNHKEVWVTMMFNMGLTALIRNLNKMTKCGLFEDPEMVTYVGNQITSVERLMKERVHPLTVLLAAKTYALGHGMKGNLEWTPVKAIVDALDAAFYLAFGTVVPINKPILFSMDVSSSMGQKLRTFKKEEDGKANDMSAPFMGNYDSSMKYEELPLTVCEAQAAIALVMARTEPNVKFGVFSQAYHLIDFDKNQTLEQATKLLSDRNFGGTDCATPFMYATVHKMEVDAFIVTTDGETWAGTPHPATAFKRYKSEAGRASRSAVVAMTSTGFSIADPSDPSMLDVCGFDTNMFTVISEFMRGEI